jgi:membrane-bound lytic murein transglycosylase MltF
VDFSSPILSGVAEIAVTGPSSPRLASVDDLSGKEVFVRRSSTYYENLRLLNERFARSGKAAVRLRVAPEDLADEDLLEMLNAGLVSVVVCNVNIASFWAKILPRIHPQREVAVARGENVVWMFRKDSPELKRAVDGCLAKYPQGSLLRNELIDQYMKSVRWVKDARSEVELARFHRTVEIFRKYGGQHDVDYLLMMAQGYQESQLNQDARIGLRARREDLRVELDAVAHRDPHVGGHVGVFRDAGRRRQGAAQDERGQSEADREAEPDSHVADSMNQGTAAGAARLFRFD